jgi:hypothetical protein
VAVVPEVAVAVADVGALGLVIGVMLVLELLYAPYVDPEVLDARTWNVYAVPLVKPVTEIGLVVPVVVMLPGVDNTLY